MGGLGAAGNRAGHRRMAEHVLEEDLRPGAAVDLGRPAGQRPAADGAELRAAAEGQVDQHRHAAIGGQRQQPFAGAAIADGIVDLDEIELFPAHDGFHLGVLAVAGTGDADVADAAGGLLLAQQRQQRVGAAQVVQLDQVEAPWCPAPRRRRRGVGGPRHCRRDRAWWRGTAARAGRSRRGWRRWRVPNRRRRARCRPPCRRGGQRQTACRAGARSRPRRRCESGWCRCRRWAAAHRWRAPAASAGAFAPVPCTARALRRRRRDRP